MKRTELTMPALVATFLVLPTIAAAQSAEALPPELLACAAETDVARRLECFDHEMARLAEAHEPAPPPAPEAEPVSEPVPAPVIADASPGPEPVVATPVAETPPAAAPAAGPEPAKAPRDDFGLPAAGPDEITAKVADIMKRPYGELVILLDNGQIWEQKHRDKRFRLDIGEDVTISAGLISGYRLTGGGRNNSIQVERIK